MPGSEEETKTTQSKCWIYWDGKGHRWVDPSNLANPSVSHDTLDKAIRAAHAAGYEITDFKMTAGAVKPLAKAIPRVQDPK